jgi:hypothetical protein
MSIFSYQLRNQNPLSDTDLLFYPEIDDNFFGLAFSYVNDSTPFFGNLFYDAIICYIGI